MRAIMCINIRKIYAGATTVTPLPTHVPWSMGEE